MNIYRQKENLKNKVDRVYAHVLDQLQGYFPGQKVSILKSNDIDLRTKIFAACKNRKGGHFLTQYNDMSMFEWYCMANDDLYVFTLTTTSSLKSYSMVVSNFQKREPLIPTLAIMTINGESFPI